VVTQQGTYVLILQSVTSRHIQIGLLGKLALHPGYYLYVGSAFGSGGLKARLNHHLKRVLKPHWHIDYLRRYTRVLEIWYTTDSVRREDDWVVHMTELPLTRIAFPGFGASDSKGTSHLFQSKQKPDLKSFCKVIEKLPDHAPVFASQRKKINHGR